MNTSKTFLTLSNIMSAREAIKATGFFAIENIYGKEYCDEIIDVIDTIGPDEKTEINFAGSELRIWDAQKRHPLLSKFNEDCNIFMSCMTGTDSEAFTLLAIRNKPLESADEASKKGRWHLDSFKQQLKIFLFLTDTTELSGPLELIPQTRSKTFRIRMLINGSLIKVAGLLNRQREYEKLNDEWVNLVVSKEYPPQPIICKAGTVLIVDTSAIHRARPCIEGTRYALTSYYD